MEVDKTSRAYMLPSKKTEYETPQDLFDKLWDGWSGFDLDPCCQRGQYTAERILRCGGTICIPSDAPYTEDEFINRVYRDGLAYPWHGKVYMNPPYGRGIGKWVEKAVHEVREGDADLVVALLPAKTGPKWWQDNILQRVSTMEWVDMEADLVQFLPGRLQFEGEKARAPFDSAIVAWWDWEWDDEFRPPR